MPVLGGSTKHYKAYGKRTTNVVNKRTDLGATKEPAWAIESDSSSSDNDDQLVGERKLSAKPVSTKYCSKVALVPPKPRPRQERHSFELVIEAARKPSSSTKSRTPKLSASSASAEESKENVEARAPTAITKKAAAADKGVNHPPATRRPPLLPKKTVQKVAVSPVHEPSTDYDSEPVIVAPKRKLARKKVVVAAESSDSSVELLTPPATPSPVVSDLSFETSVDRISSADRSVESQQVTMFVAESVTNTSVTFAVEEPAEEAQPVRKTQLVDDFASRRRSRRSLASTTSSSSSTSSRRLPSASSHPLPTELAPLLPHLLSPTIYNFTSFISAPLAPLASVSTAARSASAWWTKIGEASYSEVFATAAAGGDQTTGETVVVKVIPIADPRGSTSITPAVDTEELPFLSDWTAIQREIVTSRALGGDVDAVPGFVRFKGAFLVQGSYPEELLASWDDFKEKQSPPSDEQIRPHVFASTQLYALILLENAGTDLEAYKLKSWKEAASVFAQATDALGRAERARDFEHRDLHWGNLLLQPTARSRPCLHSRMSDASLGDEAARAVRALNLVSSTVPLSPAASGITATLIDFTLSRCAVENGAVYDPFEDDEIFEGTGDQQFDVYRRMREVVEAEGGGWQAAHLRTNVLWLHYLARKLLFAKRLKTPPPVGTSTASLPAPDSPRAVPSPRKLPFARRHTMAASSGAPFSPPPPSHRRPRTQPGGLLPGGRKAIMAERELEAERKAHSWLKAVADELDCLVEQLWRLDGRLKRSKSSKIASSGKSKQQDSSVDFSSVTCAGDLAAALFGNSSEAA
ncbi:hypothetical protein JCM10908_001658 [Rhodotorula pacifica]|uniref:uncharacterized protein n=1 Tax=Rhodotorula pacifica TaxID=1495444 RepID=UPI0031790108